MLRRRVPLAAVAAGFLALSAILTAGLAAPSAASSQTPAPRTVPPDATAALFVYRVPVASPLAAESLARTGVDVLEDRDGQDLFVLGDAATAVKLRAAGFTPTVEQTLRRTTWKAPTTRLVPNAAPLAAPIDETYDGGYHTVRAHHAHLDQIAADHPDLATVVDYGDSYLKTRNAATGYDLKAICLTHKQAGDCALSTGASKPRFLLMTQIHAREIVTGEIAWRFLDHLVSGYGSDATVTALLNSTEVWVVPIVNPDGVDLVQQGGNRPYLQRKNLDAGSSNCASPPTGSNQAGVDLNRNTADHWSTAGVSSDLCSQTYPGRSGNSEPETQAVNNLFGRLFPDQRGTGDTTAAPASTRGAMISMHSYAGMDLFPWGWSNRHTGNDAALRAIAARMSQFNGYQYGQPGEILYNASGTSDDWTYGQLGIASFTIEAASCGSFTPAYSCVTTDYNRNLPALMYVASIAGSPYASGLGPVATASATAAGTAVDVSARLDDAAFGTAGRGAVPARAEAVTAAEYSVDAPFGSAAAQPMRVSGSGTVASASAVITGLPAGRHLVYVRGRDAAGNWGPATASWVSVR